MNTTTLKYLFAVPFITYSAAALFGGAYLASTAARVQGAGAALAGLSVLAFFGVLMSKRVARFHPGLPLPVVLTTLGALLALVGAGVDGAPNASALTLALGTAVGMPIYTFWYSKIPTREQEKLRVGAPLPAVTFRTEGGEPFPVAQLGGRPALLMFFRGNWCPLCMAQIREVAAMYRELDARGVQVALISGQSEEQTAALARQFDVPFLHLRDPDLSIARTLGLFHEKALPLGMATAMRADVDAYLPTVVLVSGGGDVLEIIETDNYRVRPEPTTFLAAFARHGVTAR